MSEENNGGEGGDGGTDWKASLPVELRDDASLADVGDVATLAKRFIDTKSMVGDQNRKRIPTDDAGKEDIDSFVNDLLGREHLSLMRKPDISDPDAVKGVLQSLGTMPEDAGGYEAPEGMDAEIFGSLAAKAFERGIPKEVFEATMKDVAGVKAGGDQAASEAIAAGIAQLKGEWGHAYDQRREIVEAHVKQFMPHIDPANLTAADIKGFFDTAKQFGGEDAIIARQKQDAEYTPQEYADRRDELTRRYHAEYDNMTQGQREAMQAKIVEYSGKISEARTLAQRAG